MQGSIRQRGRSWEVRVFVGHGPSGKKIYRSATAHTRTAAYLLRNELVREVGRERTIAKRLTLAQLFEEYMSMGGPGGAGSRLQYRRNFTNHVAPSLKDVQATALRPGDLKRLYAVLLVDKGLAAATVRKVHVVLSAMLSWALEMELVTENVAKKVKAPRVSPTRIRAAPDAELRRLIAGIEQRDPLFALLIHVAAVTGTRRSEALALCWHDIAWQESTVTIRRRLVCAPHDGVGPLVEDFTKTEKVRTIALPVRVLERMHLREVEARTAAALHDITLADPAFIFTDQVDARFPFHPSSMTHKLRRERQRLGIGTRVTFLGLRHYVASVMIGSGIDVRTAAERLGNSPPVLLRTYAEFLPANDHLAAEHLERALTGSPAEPQSVTGSQDAIIAEIRAINALLQRRLRDM